MIVGDSVDFSVADLDADPDPILPDVIEDGIADVIDGGTGEDVVVDAAEPDTTIDETVTDPDTVDSAVDEGDAGAEDPLIWLIPPPDDGTV